jgi:hypothetical protein
VGRHDKMEGRKGGKTGRLYRYTCRGRKGEKVGREGRQERGKTGRL